MSHRLERTQIIRRPRAEVFPFFADAENLGRITPDFMNFRILTPSPIPMAVGTIIDYRIGMFGIPMKWRTRIEEWRPGERFVDLALKSPYRRWHHTHEFHDHAEGTLMRDVVDYELPLGFLGAPAHPLFVRPMVERIFDHRRAVIEQVFGGSA